MELDKEEKAWQHQLYRARQAPATPARRALPALPTTRAATPPREPAQPEPSQRRALPALPPGPTRAATPPRQPAPEPAPAGPRAARPLRTPPSLSSLVAASAVVRRRRGPSPSRGGTRPPPPSLPTSVGMLEVTGLSAEGLTATDRGGTSDPFVEVSVEQPGRSEKCRTPVAKRTLAPEWRAGNRFELEVRRQDAVLCCAVYDHDVMSANDFLGQATRALDAVISAAVEGGGDLGEQVLPLQPRTGGREATGGGPLPLAVAALAVDH